MKAEQLELFKEFVRDTKDVPNNSQQITIEIEGQRYQCSDFDISRMEEKLGEWKNEDGVSFWWLLRQLKNDGVKHIKLV